jgi:hypothetical protein
MFRLLEPSSGQTQNTVLVHSVSAHIVRTHWMYQWLPIYLVFIDWINYYIIAKHNGISPKNIFFIPSVAKQPNLDISHLIADVSISLTHSHTHSLTHTHTAGLLWKSDQLTAEAASKTTHNKHNRRLFMPSAGFQPVIPAISHLQTYALVLMANGSAVPYFT